MAPIDNKLQDFIQNKEELSQFKAKMFMSIFPYVGLIGLGTSLLISFVLFVINILDFQLNKVDWAMLLILAVALYILFVGFKGAIGYVLDLVQGGVAKTMATVEKVGKESIYHARKASVSRSHFIIANNKKYWFFPQIIKQLSPGDVIEIIHTRFSNIALKITAKQKAKAPKQKQEIVESLARHFSVSFYLLFYFGIAPLLYLLNKTYVVNIKDPHFDFHAKQASFLFFAFYFFFLPLLVFPMILLQIFSTTYNLDIMYLVGFAIKAVSYFVITLGIFLAYKVNKNIKFQLFPFIKLPKTKN